MTNHSIPEKKPLMREQILDVACTLLNARGMNKVTTGMVAESAGLDEGDLYYYFRTKEELCLALLARLEEEALRLFSTHISRGPALPPYAAMLRNWLLLSWSYRFLFRDIGAFSTFSPAMRRRLRQLSLRLRTEMERVLEELRILGLMTLEDAARERFLANLWIVGSYWMVYLALHQGLRTIRPEHLAWGLAQMHSLYEPHLTPAAHAQLAMLPKEETPFSPA